jgi:hypothetical protein
MTTFLLRVFIKVMIHKRTKKKAAGISPTALIFMITMGFVSFIATHGIVLLFWLS